jgi:hypothetical protein
MWMRTIGVSASAMIRAGRRPCRQVNRLPFQIETLIVQLKKEHPSWGAPKIREKICRLHSEISLPAISTVHAVLDRHNLVPRGRKPRWSRAISIGTNTTEAIDATRRTNSHL